MKPRIEKLLPPSTASFIYRVRREPRFGAYWHYHPEYQLTLVLRGRGKRFVGDEISTFKEGDLVLTGPNLPHMWCSAPNGSRHGAPHEAIMIQFPESIFGGEFLGLPEMTPVRTLLSRSARGLRFDDGVRRKVAGRIVRMRRERGLERLIGLLEVLGVLAQAPAAAVLSSRSFGPLVAQEDRERIDRICHFVAEHSVGPLRLRHAADAAHMSVPAFTRFIRKCTGKSFVELLTEIRVGNACRLLMETERSVSEICFGAGFSNLSTFNRRFLALKGKTPRQFRQEFSS